MRENNTMSVMHSVPRAQILDVKPSAVPLSVVGNGGDGVLQRARRSIRAGLVDCFCLSRDCIIGATRGLDSEISFVPFNTIRDCITYRERDLDIIIYYSHEETPLDRLTNQEITTLRQAYSDLPIIVLSDAKQAVQSSIVRDALRSGARGFISTRTIEMPVVSAAIRYVMEGGTVVPVDIILNDQGPASDAYHRLPPQIGLTTRQVTVLTHLRQGKANKIIAHDLNMSESTVKVHVRNIMRKMGATNRTQAVYKARQFYEASASQGQAEHRA